MGVCESRRELGYGRSLVDRKRVGGCLRVVLNELGKEECEVGRRSYLTRKASFLESR